MTNESKYNFARMFIQSFRISDNLARGPSIVIAGERENILITQRCILYNKLTYRIRFGGGGASSSDDSSIHHDQER